MQEQFPCIEVPASFFDQLAEDPIEALLPLWEVLEKHGIVAGCYPVETRLVLLLATSVGLDCSVRMLAHYLQRGELDPPPKFGGQHAWRPADISRLLVFLYERRKFLPGRFWSEKTDAERRRDNAEAAQSLRLVAHLAQLSDYELEKLLQETKTSPMREMVHFALRTRQDERRAAHSLN